MAREHADEVYGAYADRSPAVCTRFGHSTTPVAVSDLISRREFKQLELYQEVCGPLAGEEFATLYLPPAGATTRFDWRRPAPHLSALGLTPRERRLLELLATGATNAGLAAQLWISPHTVRAHLEHIFEKTGVRTRTEAAALVRQPLERTAI